MSFTFDSAFCTTQGRRRYQEDTGLLWPGPVRLEACAPLPDGHLLAVLGDGMGGHVGGATASRIACAAFASAFSTDIVEGDPRLADRLARACYDANGALARKTAEEPQFNGMGTTLVGIHLAPFELGSGLSWVSVGDSLLYLWRRGEIARLNEDHSLAPELDKLAEMGRMSWTQAMTDPRRHYLRAALTGEDIELMDVTPRPLPVVPDDVLLIASDGILTLDDGAIGRIVDANFTDGAAAIARALIAGIDGAGQPNQDNATVIAIRVGGEG